MCIVLQTLVILSPCASCCVVMLFCVIVVDQEGRRHYLSLKQEGDVMESFSDFAQCSKSPHPSQRGFYKEAQEVFLRSVVPMTGKSSILTVHSTSVYFFSIEVSIVTALCTTPYVLLVWLFVDELLMSRHLID